MGLYHATCAFTRTAIDFDDEILLVKINPSNPTLKHWETYVLDVQCHDYTKNPEAYIGKHGSLFDRVEVGTYNGYGDLNENSFIYDEDFPYKDFFYAHKSVVEALLDREIDRHDLISDACNIVGIADLARIQLANTALLGQQFFDRLEYKHQAKIFAESSRILSRNLARVFG